MHRGSLQDQESSWTHSVTLTDAGIEKGVDVGTG